MGFSEAVGPTARHRAWSVCAALCVCVCSAIVEAAETEMPSITKAERPWQGLGVLTVLFCPQCAEQLENCAIRCSVEVFVLATVRITLNI